MGIQTCLTGKVLWGMMYVLQSRDPLSHNVATPFNIPWFIGYSHVFEQTYTGSTGFAPNPIILFDYSESPIMNNPSWNPCSSRGSVVNRNLNLKSFSWTLGTTSANRSSRQFSAFGLRNVRHSNVIGESLLVAELLCVSEKGWEQG